MGLQTQAMKLDRVQSVQYLGMWLDDKLSWHEHVNQTCASLIKYAGIFNHIKNFVSVEIARELYLAFVYLRIQYGIGIYGNCAKEMLSKLQVMQNKLLELHLKYHRRTSTHFLHHVMLISQLNDMHIVKVLSFVNECRSGRIPNIFLDYYKVRETGLDLRNNRTLDIPWARNQSGSKPL